MVVTKKHVSLMVAAAAGLIVGGRMAPAAIIITEVDPAGSVASYAADWYELTNTGTSAVDITGWKMDDNSELFASAVPLTGVTSIGAGKSVVFLEDTAALKGGSTDAALNSTFEAAWFGNSVPAGFTIGNYGGTSVGLSQTADAVNIYNASGVKQAGVQFGITVAGPTLDNSVLQLTSTTDPVAGVSTDPVIGTFSTVATGSMVGPGTAGASGTNETGSPGYLPTVVTPEPASVSVLALVAGALLARRKRA